MRTGSVRFFQPHKVSNNIRRLILPIESPNIAIHPFPVGRRPNRLFIAIEALTAGLRFGPGIAARWGVTLEAVCAPLFALN